MERELTNDEIVQIYDKNREEINMIWTSIGDECTLKDAVMKWIHDGNDWKDALSTEQED